jgi:hypothetical protein
MARGGYRIGAGRKIKGDDVKYSYTRYLTKKEIQEMDTFLEKIRGQLNENIKTT